jgi:hypothetical protein
MTGTAADAIADIGLRIIKEHEARIAKLEAALKPFAGLADEMERVAADHNTDPDGVAVHVDYKDAAAARAALIK